MVFKGTGASWYKHLEVRMSHFSVISGQNREQEVRSQALSGSLRSWATVLIIVRTI